MTKNKLCYIGESIDYSDQWLVAELSRKFAVTIITPNALKQKKPLQGFDIIINRLYTSAVSRHGKQAIARLVAQLKKREKLGDRVINSSQGYLIDLDRIKQYHFFRKYNIPFVPIYTTAQALSNSKHVNYPVVPKLKTSGRNKYLEIVKDADELRAHVSLNQRSKVIVQPLIKNAICYRTECIGTVSITFPQQINIRNNRLSFTRIPRIIKTPVARKFIDHLVKTLRKIGVQAFSVEYFLINSIPHIVDFNLTSNYTSFLISTRGAQIKRAWLGIIT